MAIIALAVAVATVTVLIILQLFGTTDGSGTGSLSQLAAPAGLARGSARAGHGSPLSSAWTGDGKPVTLAFGGDVHFEGPQLY